MKLEHHNFTIYEVEEIKESLIQLLEKEQVLIDLDNVRKIDMSAIQLLVCLKKSCELHDKEFQIINVNEEILDSFEISGVAYILGVYNG